MQQSKLLPNFIVLLLLLVACQGEDLVDDRVPAEIRVLDSFTNIFVGQKKSFDLVYLNIIGAKIENPDFIWVSSNPSVLTVNSDGEVTAVATGNATITVSIVTLDGKTISRTFQVEVQSNVIPPSEITIAPSLEITTDTKSLLKGNQLDIEFNFSDSNSGDDLEPDSITWFSKDEQIISVDENGKITAIEIGKTTIVLTITFESQTFEQEIELGVVVTPELKIESERTTIFPNQTLKVSSVFNGFDGQAVEGVEVTYTSSDTNIITVDKDGKITAIIQGTADIVANVVYEGKSYESTLSITVHLQPRISLTNTVESLTQGDSQEFKATFFDENGDENSEVTLTWKTNNSDAITISQDGTITAIQPSESVVITVTAQYNGQTYQSEFTLKVTTRPIEAVLKITQKPSTLEHDGQSQVEFTFTNKSNNQIIEPDSITWKSNDVSVVTVDDNGTITAQGEGSTTVMVTIVYEGNTFEESFTVNVMAENQTILVEPELKLNSTPSSLEQGDQSQLSYSFINKTNDQALDPDGITWESADENIVSIGSDGELTAKGPGTTTVTLRVEYDGDSFSESFSVRVWVEPTIEITSSFSKLKVGNSQTLTHTTTDDQGVSTDDITVTWSSSDTSKITVDEKGLIRAIATGTVTITATISYDGKSIQDRRSITAVVDPVISITSTIQRLDKDDTETLVFEFIDELGQKRPLQSVTWSSSDTDVISVDSNGKIAAKKVGRAVIKVTAQVGSSSISDTITIDVIVEPAVSISNPAGGIIEGTSYDFNFEFTGDDGQSVSPDSVTWSSSDTDVLTIDNDGVITTVAPGSSTITVTVTYQNQSYSKSIKFTIAADPNKSDATETKSFKGTLSGSYGLTGSYEVKADGDDLLIILKKDFNINNSLPDGALYLSNSSRRNSSSKLIWRGRSHYKGPKTYTVKNTRLRDYQYLVFWCIAFNVHVGNAKLFDDE